MIKFLKRYLPKSLYPRTLLILILPIFLAQAIAVYVFYERHWSNVSRHLAASLAGEVATILDHIKNEPDETQINKFLQTTKKLFSLTAIYTSEDVANSYLTDYTPQKFSYYQAKLKRLIGKDFLVYYNDDKGLVVTKVLFNNDKVLLIEASDKRLLISSSYIFIIWMVGVSFILTLIAVMFLRGQIRPIIKLARLADNFGRGYDISANFKPQGAKEIKQAANAFLLMKDRITRHLRQRTDMLAGISHDLRTPLTRMKLELALLENKGVDETIEGLKNDISEMESMVNSYLEFVRGDDGEDVQDVDLNELVEAVVSKMNGSSNVITFNKSQKTVKASVRPFLLSRAVKNLISNAIKFGNKAEVSVFSWQDTNLIIVDDNGQGIPADKREEVFKPFLRLETSRNKSTGGIGLGLSIVRDIVNSHGGTVELGQSELGGLRAMIRLPA